MSGAPRLSVGLPVYNGEGYVAESIEALLGQTYEDFELIISDNASTDATPDICRRYERQDSRIHFVRQARNIGLSPNHNVVLDQARGEFFKWAAADDLYGRNLFRRCIDALDERPDVVLAHSYQGVVSPGGDVTQALDYPLATDAPRAPDRFRSILFGGSGVFESRDPARPGLVRVDNAGILRACDEYGVIRTAVLRDVAPLGSYHHADRIVVCELALRGRFHITPEWLYFRRDRSDRTYNVSPRLRTRCEIMDPVRRNRVLHPTARLVAEYFWGYVEAVRRAPLSAADRLECYRDLARWMTDRAIGTMRNRRLVSTTELDPAADHTHEVDARAVVAGQGMPPS